MKTDVAGGILQLLLMDLSYFIHVVRGKEGALIRKLGSKLLSVGDPSK